MKFEREAETEIEITDISVDGQGIGRKDGVTFFVAGGKGIRPVYGDVATVEISECKKRFFKASVKELKKPSALRNAPICDKTEECGGCMLQNMTYEGQLALKQKQIRDKYTGIARLNAPETEEICGMEKPFRYRNKAQIAVGNGAVGFFGNKSHKVTDCETCLINARPAETVADVVRKFIKKHNISTYDRITGKGLLRHVIVRTAFGTGEVMVVFVVNGDRFPRLEEMIKLMDTAIDGIDDSAYSLESVVLNINTKKTSRVTGEKYITLAGKPTIVDVLRDLKFEISPASFYQVNPVQTEKLYDKVLEYANLTGAETVLDIYCGAGAIGLWCASKAKHILGIERVKEAVLAANRNAVINGIVNVRYIHGLAEVDLPKLVSGGLEADVVILDPPAAGCKRELLEAAAQTGAKRIVYVSCDIATQARDIKILDGLGYAFVSAAPVDMFPWSINVEAVALLVNRRKP